MERGEYGVMFHVEDSHWWYWGLRDLVLPVAAVRTPAGGPATVLDAGCGTGKHLEALRAAGANAVGLELAGEAFPYLRLRGLDAAARASVCRVPFPDEAFDLVLSTDVLCCVEPPALGGALGELVRVLKPGGRLVLNLPAYQFLRSRHDAAVHTRQRFTRGAVVSMLKRAGLEPHTVTYRNTLLFPPAALVRLATRGRGGAATSDLAPPPRPLNALLKWPLYLENRWIRAGGRLPFGLSVFCVAGKPSDRGSREAVP